MLQNGSQSDTAICTLRAFPRKVPVEHGIVRTHVSSIRAELTAVAGALFTGDLFLGGLCENPALGQHAT